MNKPVGNKVHKAHHRSILTKRLRREQAGAPAFNMVAGIDAAGRILKAG